MSFILQNKGLGLRIENALGKARSENQDSLERLSSGQVFTSSQPKPADQALANRLEFKQKALAASKRNVSDAVSLLQTADSGFNEVSHMLQRMKEINMAAASTTLSDMERKYLFIEHDALHQEIDRLAASTEFNGIPLLDGSRDQVPERLIFRVDDAVRSAGAPEDSGDFNEIHLDRLKEIVVNTTGLNLRSIGNALQSEEGVDLETAREILEPTDGRFSSIYDEALEKLSQYRAIYGGLQTRLDRVTSFHEVMEENIAAARSQIADTDYAKEVSSLAQNNILLQAGTALLTQNNLAAGTALHLIQALLS